MSAASPSPRPSSSPRRTLLFRVGLSLATVMLLLIGVEGGLRIAAKVYAGHLRRSRQQQTDVARQRLLCVGDSNTFGVRVSVEDSYPGRLQRLLNADGLRRFQVLNRGIPGQNSAQILNHLDEELLAARPDVLLVLAGVNNGWNLSGRGTPSWIDKLRLVRWIRLAVHDARTGDRGAGGISEMAAVEGNSTVRSYDELKALTRDDLIAIVEEARAAGVITVLMTYPGQHPGMAPHNEAAREAAEQSGAPLVDLDRSFAEYVRKYGFDALMFEDSHLAEAGYELMAREIVNVLADANVVVTQRVDVDRPPERLRPPTVLTLRHDDGGKPVRLDLLGEPGEHFQVLISPKRTPEINLGPRRIPLGPHPWVELCKAAPTLQGVLDDAGRASVALPDQVQQATIPLYCAFVTRDQHAVHSLAVRSISNGVEIRPRRDG